MEPTKRCPLCAEVILAAAVRCKHCQSDLRFLAPTEGGSASPPVGENRPPPPPTILSADLPRARVIVDVREERAEPRRPESGEYAAAPDRSSARPYRDDGRGREARSGRDFRDDHDPRDGHDSHDSRDEFRDERAHARPESKPEPKHEPKLEPWLPDYVPPPEGDFEQRFLDFAFKTSVPINGASVAYALKVPIDEAVTCLEDMAARDILIREVDQRGAVFFQLPGRPAPNPQSGNSTALTPYSQPPALLYDPPSTGLATRPPTESTALVGLLVNALLPPPGIGSLIGGKTSAGVFQILLFVVGLAFCATVVGLPVGVPMVFGSWIWGLVTGVNTLNEAKQQNAQTRL